MGGESGNAHRNEGSFGSRHRPDGGEELIGPGPVHDAEERLAARGQLK